MKIPQIISEMGVNLLGFCSNSRFRGKKSSTAGLRLGKVKEYLPPILDARYGRVPPERIRA